MMTSSSKFPSLKLSYLEKLVFFSGKDITTDLASIRSLKKIYHTFNQKTLQ